MIIAEPLRSQSGILHGFFTREGGVSSGPYDSLNCGLGSRDDPACVRENRSRAMARLDLSGGDLATAYQVHSADCIVVDSPWPAGDRPRADGLVTRTRGLALGILTADCTPVLLADGDAGVVGAAHAGWRGAKSGILEATVATMERLGGRADRITAAAGPCIRQESYEVGPEFRAAFTADDPATADLFQPSDRPNHHLFDLPGYVARRLAAIGIAAIEVLPWDTCADARRFFSYRRTVLDGGGDYGRLLSAIALAP